MTCIAEKYDNNLLFSFAVHHEVMDGFGRVGACRYFGCSTWLDRKTCLIVINWQLESAGKYCDVYSKT